MAGTRNTISGRARGLPVLHRSPADAPSASDPAPDRHTALVGTGAKEGAVHVLRDMRIHNHLSASDRRRSLAGQSEVRTGQAARC